MEKPLIALLSLTAANLATMSIVYFMVGRFWYDGVSVYAAAGFAAAEFFIVAGTIGPALMRWMGDKDA